MESKANASNRAQHEAKIKEVRHAERDQTHAPLTTQSRTDYSLGRRLACLLTTPSAASPCAPPRAPSGCLSDSLSRSVSVPAQLPAHLADALPPIAAAGRNSHKAQARGPTVPEADSDPEIGTAGHVGGGGRDQGGAGEHPATAHGPDLLHTWPRPDPLAPGTALVGLTLRPTSSPTPDHCFASPSPTHTNTLTPTRSHPHAHTHTLTPTCSHPHAHTHTCLIPIHPHPYSTGDAFGAECTQVEPGSEDGRAGEAS